MRKISYLMFITTLFFSCNKLNDFFPGPKTPAPQFNKVYGGANSEFANSITATLDGYVMAGYTYSNDGDISGNHGVNDAWVVKLDKQGNKLWQKTLGGSNSDEANSIITTLDGYVMVGQTESNDGDVSGNHGNTDAWVVKLDKDGNIRWQKTLGGSDRDIALSITISLDGYVMAGYTVSNDGDVSGNHGVGDVWVVKLDKNGNIRWQKTFGGSDFEVAYSITTGLDGGYVFAGFTGSNDGDVSGNHANGDVWIVKLDKNGNIRWQKTLGGSNSDLAKSVIPTLDRGYVLAGSTGSNDGGVSGNHGGFSDAWIVKLDKEGNKVWQKALGGSKDDVANSIIATLDGYIMAGQTPSNDGDVSGNHGGDFYGDAWVVKLDKNGNIRWQKTLGGSKDDVANSIIATLDGRYVFVGATSSNDGDVSGNHGNTDAWVMTIKDK